MKQTKYRKACPKGRKIRNGLVSTREMRFFIQGENFLIEALLRQTQYLLQLTVCLICSHDAFTIANKAINIVLQLTMKDPSLSDAMRSVLSRSFLSILLMIGQRQPEPPDSSKGAHFHQQLQDRVKGACLLSFATSTDTMASVLPLVINTLDVSALFPSLLLDHSKPRSLESHPNHL
jgi:hypothetical protein